MSYDVNQARSSTARGGVTMPVYETKKVTAAVSTKNRGARRSGHANEDSTTDHRQYQELKYAVNQAVL